MFSLENEDRNKTTYAERFAIVIVRSGAFDSWSRGGVRTHVAGSVKLKEPGEVNRDLLVHAPFSLQGAAFTVQAVTAAAEAMGLRGEPHFKDAGLGPADSASRLVFAMHDALVRPDATALERETLVSETLGELLCTTSHLERAPRAVRRARDYLHDAIDLRITLDGLADYAGLDKFHLVRAFRAEMGLPPYEYLTYLRVARAKVLLGGGMRVAEAAQVVGLYDESQLHRHFRRIVGVAPGAYARSIAASRTRGHRVASEPRVRRSSAVAAIEPTSPKVDARG